MLILKDRRLLVWIEAIYSALYPSEEEEAMAITGTGSPEERMATRIGYRVFDIPSTLGHFTAKTWATVQTEIKAYYNEEFTEYTADGLIKALIVHAVSEYCSVREFIVGIILSEMEEPDQIYFMDIIQKYSSDEFKRDLHREYHEDRLVKSSEDAGIAATGESLRESMIDISTEDSSVFEVKDPKLYRWLELANGLIDQPPLPPIADSLTHTTVTKSKISAIGAVIFEGSEQLDVDSSLVPCWRDVKARVDRYYNSDMTTYATDGYIKALIVHSVSDMCSMRAEFVELITEDMGEDDQIYFMEIIQKYSDHEFRADTFPDVDRESVRLTGLGGDGLVGSSTIGRPTLEFGNIYCKDSYKVGDHERISDAANMLLSSTNRDKRETVAAAGRKGRLAESTTVTPTLMENMLALSDSHSGSDGGIQIDISGAADKGIFSSTGEGGGSERQDWVLKEDEYEEEVVPMTRARNATIGENSFMALRGALATGTRDNDDDDDDDSYDGRVDDIDVQALLRDRREQRGALRERAKEIFELSKELALMTERYANLSDRMEEVEAASIAQDKTIRLMKHEAHEMSERYRRLDCRHAETLAALARAQEEAQGSMEQLEAVQDREAERISLREKVEVLSDCEKRLNEELSLHHITFTKLINCETKLGVQAKELEKLNKFRALLETPENSHQEEQRQEVEVLLREAQTATSDLRIQMEKVSLENTVQAKRIREMEEALLDTKGRHSGYADPDSTVDALMLMENEDLRSRLFAVLNPIIPNNPTISATPTANAAVPPSACSVCTAQDERLSLLDPKPAVIVTQRPELRVEEESPELDTVLSREDSVYEHDQQEKKKRKKKVVAAASQLEVDALNERLQAMSEELSTARLVIASMEKKWLAAADSLYDLREDFMHIEHEQDQTTKSSAGNEGSVLRFSLIRSSIYTGSGSKVV